MGFAASGLHLMIAPVGPGPRLWYYTSTDAHATVEGASYFVGMGNGTGSVLTSRDMRLGDLVLVHRSGTVQATLHAVSAVSAAGDVTIAAALFT